MPIGLDEHFPAPLIKNDAGSGRDLPGGHRLANDGERFFGNTVRDQTAAIAQELAGGNGATAQANAQTAAPSAEADPNTRRNLSNYTGNAAR